MKYGRQRWKLKGKIEVNGRQSWDREEMVFLPLITGLISIKVECPWLLGVSQCHRGDHMWVPQSMARRPLCAAGSGAGWAGDTASDVSTAPVPYLLPPLTPKAMPSRSLRRSQRSKGWRPTSWWAA